MKFLISLIDDGSWIEQATPEQVEKMVSEMDGFIDEMTKEGVYVSGEGLAPPSSAKTLRYGEDGQPVITDGPFAETKEHTAGYFVIQCDSIEDAIEWVTKMPDPEKELHGGGGGGAVEIRQIVDTAEENVEMYKEAAKA
jgi:hypothetical protein